ncbi:sulfur carrier protein ThiS [Alkalihalobacillus sp. AL-G]|uniref:sulfur carrier protein ThiS n=1 Tax=Alkalihalobacillus sp. AL-G TaxID=2926399 RepID=UPI0027294F23|nr:sulfur carrier protein ThiS [Alkalihalobacillus sp. AL-G]WLD93895.1 sulfur carrier protein ThiS [Alkalihalobacillus sp. AL-G]
MRLRINGDTVEVPDTVATVSELVEYFELNNRVVMVELNENILDKQTHPEAKVADGDKLEIVQFVGGG